jgi:hypothetical protein
VTLPAAHSYMWAFAHVTVRICLEQDQLQCSLAFGVVRSRIIVQQPGYIHEV